MENKNSDHNCPCPKNYGDGYQAICSGRITGKVLAIELVSDKFDKTDKPCLKIRINEWRNLRNNKECAVYYGIKTYGEKRPPEIEKSYYFFLHEVKGINHLGEKYNQRGWQWAHDWQLVAEE